MATKLAGRTFGLINEFTMWVPLNPGRAVREAMVFMNKFGTLEFNSDFKLHQSNLKHIGTVHFLRAVMVEDFGLEPARLLFNTEFDRDPERYLDDFSDDAHKMFDLVLGMVEGYPGARPVDRFVEWVRSVQVKTLCFWAAYDEPVRKIKLALSLLKDLEAEKSSGSPLERARYHRQEFHRMVARAPIIGDQALKTNDLTIIVPVLPGHLDALHALADDSTLMNQRDNALAALGTVHFARVALLENETLLLFAVEFDGEREPFLQTLSEQAAPLLDQVLVHGEGYPGAQPLAAFQTWVERNRKEHLAWYADPGESVSRIKEALRALDAMA